MFFDKDVNSKQGRAEYSFLRVNPKSKIYISNVCLFSMLKEELITMRTSFSYVSNSNEEKVI